MRDKSIKLREITDSFFTPVVLGSKTALQMKKDYEDFQKHQNKPQRKKVSPPPKDRIIHWLNRFENGEADAWWMALREMTLEETSTNYDNVFNYDIDSLPGWINSSSEIRQRLLNSADNSLN